MTEEGRGNVHCQDVREKRGGYVRTTGSHGVWLYPTSMWGVRVEGADDTLGETLCVFAESGHGSLWALGSVNISSLQRTAYYQ